MRTKRESIGPRACAVALLLCAAGLACSKDAKPAYPARAPLEQYHSIGAAAEIALARSAAPSSISGDASIMIFGDHGYETAFKGKNGFVCLVQRAWASDFGDDGFWNPKLRAPICFNSAAVRSILPAYLARTQWVLAGDSKDAMLKRTRAELAAHRIAAPDPGALAYMMSKQQDLGRDGHWHPHLMFFYARTDAADWGADLKGSPISASISDLKSITTFYVLVPAWSDGTPAIMESH